MAAAQGGPSFVVAVEHCDAGAEHGAESSSPHDRALQSPIDAA